MRLEVKLERSLGWLQMRLPRMAWEKGMEPLVDWGWQLKKVEILLVVGGFDVDGGAEVRLVNIDVNIQEGDMGRGDGPGKFTYVNIMILHTC